MFDKIQLAENRYEEVTNMLSDPNVISNQSQYRKLMKEHADLEALVQKYKEYKDTCQTISETRAMLDEPLEEDFRELCQEEFKEAQERLEVLKKELKILLLPKDPNDDRNVIVEIRGGAGGEEAALFAGVLYRMFTRYAERRGFKTTLMDASETEIGGFKEVVFSIEGQGAYSRFKFESGVHRVQRVPETETQGRIHTSTVTVAVLPEVDDVEITINPADLEMQVYRASGAGGQHINKTSSAVRITHKPSGIVVACQEERSQLQNREKAMTMLKAKLYDIAQREQTDAIAQDRKSQVGTGDRGEKIRTYNYPQGRVTEHRIGLTLYKLEAILNGDMDDIVDALITNEQAEKLGNAGDNGGDEF